MGWRWCPRLPFCLSKYAGVDLCVHKQFCIYCYGVHISSANFILICIWYLQRLLTNKEGLKITAFITSCPVTTHWMRLNWGHSVPRWRTDSCSNFEEPPRCSREWWVAPTVAILQQRWVSTKSLNPPCLWSRRPALPLWASCAFSWDFSLSDASRFS